MLTTYYATVAESAAGANKRHLAVWNGTGTGKRMTLFRIIAIGTPTAAVTGAVIPLAAIRLLTRPTSGSALGWAKADPANPDPPSGGNPNGIEVAANVSGGTVESVAFGLGAVSGEETIATPESVVYSAPIDGSQAVVFPPGSGFEVRQLTLASAGAVSITCVIGLADVDG